MSKGTKRTVKYVASTIATHQALYGVQLMLPVNSSAPMGRKTGKRCSIMPTRLKPDQNLQLRRLATFIAVCFEFEGGGGVSRTGAGRLRRC